MAKAGSTLLQHFLSHNESRLASAGYFYAPVCRQGVAHHPLSRELASPYRGSVQTALIREFLDDHQDSSVIISSEGFEAANPRTVRDALAGYDVKIICYARDTVRRLPSFYSQNTKYGLNILDFDRFFESMRVESNRKWLYGRLFQEWADTFGPSNIRVRSLDRAQLDHGDLVGDFLSAVGLTKDGLADPDSRQTMLNESPAWKTVEAIRSLQAAAVGDSSPEKKMQDPVTWKYLRRTFQVAQEVAADLGWTDRGIYLSTEQAALLTSLYEAQLTLIESLGIDARLAPSSQPECREFMPEVGRIPTEELAYFMSRVSPRLIRAMLQESETTKP